MELLGSSLEKYLKSLKYNGLTRTMKDTTADKKKIIWTVHASSHHRCHGFLLIFGWQGGKYSKTHRTLQAANLLCNARSACAFLMVFHAGTSMTGQIRRCFL